MPGVPVRGHDLRHAFMPAFIKMDAVEGKMLRIDDGSEVDEVRAVCAALPYKGVREFGIAGAHEVHIHGAFAPGFRYRVGNLHGNAHNGAYAHAGSPAAYAADVRQRHGHVHAHEEVVQPAHDEKLIAAEFLLRHFSGGRSVDAPVDEGVPRTLRGQGAPGFRPPYAVTVGKTVAYAENVHDGNRCYR